MMIKWFVKKRFLPLIFFFFVYSNFYSVEIEKISQIQVAGLITVKAKFSSSSSNVTWKVNSYTIDEITSVRTEQGVISVPYRDSIRILLVKPSGKYSFYEVIVYENDLKDSVGFQVFNKGIREKYLWINKFIPNKPIPVHLILPNNFSPSSKFLISMHGVDRNANDYAEIWKSFANNYNYVIAAPEFNNTDWPKDSYSLGNMFSGEYGLGVLNPTNIWTFSFVKEIQRELRMKCGLKDSTYIIWGHSAGAQFVHRMAFFFPDNLISIYIAANSGWYTLPDLNVLYPWGLKHNLLNYSSSDLIDYALRNLVIMRGTADTLRDKNLNTEAPSDAQGKNRFERAAYFFKYGKQITSESKWKLIDVPNVGHDATKMANAAMNFLLSSTAVSSNDSFVNDKLELSNFPNPFNNSTQIFVSINKASFYQVNIYNVLGEKISTLANEFLTPGNYTYTFNAENISSGIYLCTISSGSYHKSVKILLLK